MTRLDAVRLLRLTQDALEELDRFNIATARSHIFDLNWQLRDIIKLLDAMELHADITRDD